MDKVKQKPLPISLPHTTVTTAAPLLTPDVNGTLPSPDMIKLFTQNERSIANGRCNLMQQPP